MTTIRGITAVIVLTVAGSAGAQAVCDRACLTGYVDTYFNALAAGSARSFPLARSAKITLNGRETGLAETLWEGAGETAYRWDIVNERLGDTATEAIVSNTDGTKTMMMLRLKVLDGEITEVEIVRANEGDADRLWGPDRLTEVSPELTLTIRPADQDSYYGLIAAAEGYWRAFQTNGSGNYHPAPLLPDTERYENGLQTTGFVRDGQYVSAAAGFDSGRFSTRNLWDRRYPVVDTERGIVLSIVRFGTKTGAQSQNPGTTNDRLVAEFFSVKSGMIQEVHAVLYNLPEDVPTGWEPDYGPGPGGW
jgi:hypothetical protein